MHLLKESGLSVKGKDAIIVGASNIVGRPYGARATIGWLNRDGDSPIYQNLNEKSSHGRYRGCRCRHPWSCERRMD